MATDLQSAKPGVPVKPAASKYEVYVEEHLTRARRRIRSLDLAAGGLGFLVVTLAYGLLMALLDRKLEFASLTRQMLFATYVLGAAAYLCFLVVLPLFRRINPYYAARCIESTLPEAKNSVVNYLDFRQETIPPAFRNAIGHKAAKDLAQADLEEAISAKRTSWLGGAVSGLLLALLIVYVMSPQQFVSLMNRAFAPFVEASIATRTRLTLVQPEGGDLVIPVGRAVSFNVWVDGRIPDAANPDALKLQYRYNPTDPFEARALEQGDGPRQWVTQIRAGEVHNGFWYKVTGGDAETPEYRVQVHSSPLLTGFDVTYHYRPYLRWRDQITHDGNLKGLRGTEVTLVAHTNRALKDGQLVIAGQNPMNAELAPADPNALRFRFTLDKDGAYRIWFTSVEGERNIEPLPYTIHVAHDQAPVVELKKPGTDTNLPANGALQLEGSASDDHGLANLTLRMKLQNPEVPLQPRPYRGGKPLLQGDGSLPLMLDYKDFVELEKIKLASGGAVKLEKNQAIEYWLEARDSCDYPSPNTGESKHFRLTIQDPDRDKNQQQKEQKQAEQNQKKHEDKQDEQLNQQKQEPQPDQGNDQNQEQQPADQPKDQQPRESPQDQPKQAPQNQQPNNGKQEPDKNQQQGAQEGEKTKQSAGKESPQDQSKQAPQSQQPNEGKQEPDKNQQQGAQEGKQTEQSASNGAKNSKDDELKDQAEKIQKELDKQQQEQGKQQDKEQGKQSAKESGKEQGKEQDKESGKESGREQGKESGKEQGKDSSQQSRKKQGKDSGKERGKEQGKESGREQGKESGKESATEQGKESGKESGQPSRKEQGKDPGKEQGKEQGKESGKEQGKESGKESATEQGKEGGKEQGKESAKQQGKDQGKEPGKESATEQGKEAGKEHGNESGQPSRKDQGKDSGKDQGKEQPKESGKESAAEQGKGSSKEQGKEQGKESAKEQGKESGKEQGKDSTKGQGKDSSKEQGKEPGKEQHKDSSSESGKEQGKAPAKEQGKESGKEQGKESSKDQRKDSGQESGKEHGKNSGKEQGKESGKEHGKDSGKEQGKGSGKEQGKEQGKGSDSKEESGSGNQSKGSGGGGAQGGDGPGNNKAKPAETTGDAAPENKLPGTPADKRFQKKAGDLNLPAKIDKNTLKQLNMTDEEYQNFRKAYEEMLRRKAAAPEEKEKLAGPQQGNRTMPNQGVRRVGPSEKNNAGKLERGGTADAPRKFREAYKAFSRDVSEMGPPEKK